MKGVLAGAGLEVIQFKHNILPVKGLHKLWYPGIRDTSTWSKFGAHGEHGDVFGEPCSGLALGEP